LKTHTCNKCDDFGACKDTASSWVFLFIGLLATVSIRLVNLVFSVSALWAKLLWYVGVIGFLVYFLYKFRQDLAIKYQLNKSLLEQKLVTKSPLNDEDYLFIRTVLCGLRSKKDTINYFFIFFTSALALLLGLWQDFLIRP
jgi:hypothetical protein